MSSVLQKARKLARQLQEGMTVLDGETSQELAETLDALICAVEDQDEKLTAAELALNYYSEPQLYLNPEFSADQPILDEGLRARTALSVMSRPVRQMSQARGPVSLID